MVLPLGSEDKQHLTVIEKHRDREVLLVFAELGAEVYSVEIIAPFVEPAAQRLARLGYGNVSVKHGDGYLL